MIQISLETQSFIDDLIASGRFESRQAAIEEAVRRLREELDANGQDRAGHLSAQQWCEQFEMWVISHRALPQEADDEIEREPDQYGVPSS